MLNTQAGFYAPAFLCFEMVLQLLPGPSSRVLNGVIPPTAPEQHAGRDHLDAAGGEARGLHTDPCQSDHVLHLQRGGHREALRANPDRLPAGTLSAY